MTHRLVVPGARVMVDADSGGRLGSLVIGGRERLVTTPMAGVAPSSMGWGCFLMAPWVGRMRDGILAWKGIETVLPANQGRHAIHGAVFDRPWQVDRDSSDELELRIDFTPERWPIRGHVRQRFALRPGLLTLTAIVEADEPMPVGLGWHPWFRHEVDEPIQAMVPASGVLETTGDVIPTGRVLPLDPRTDLRTLAVIGDRALDHAYVGLEGRSATVAWPDLTLTLSGDPAITNVVVHSRPGGLCVEPQTAWPDAHRLDAMGVQGTGLTVVRPGRPFSASIALAW